VQPIAIVRKGRGAVSNPAGHELVEVFQAWLDEHFPERRARVVARLREMRGGRDNDPRFGWRMRGDLFEPPAAAGRGQGSPSIPRHPFAAPPIQGSLF
jgi:hypothetical protein